MYKNSINKMTDALKIAKSEIENFRARVGEAGRLWVPDYSDAYVWENVLQTNAKILVECLEDKIKPGVEDPLPVAIQVPIIVSKLNETIERIVFEHYIAVQSMYVLLYVNRKRPHYILQSDNKTIEIVVEHLYSKSNSQTRPLKEINEEFHRDYEIKQLMKVYDVSAEFLMNFTRSIPYGRK